MNPIHYIPQQSNDGSSESDVLFMQTIQDFIEKDLDVNNDPSMNSIAHHTYSNTNSDSHNNFPQHINSSPYLYLPVDLRPEMPSVTISDDNNKNINTNSNLYTAYQHPNCIPDNYSSHCSNYGNNTAPIVPSNHMTIPDSSNINDYTIQDSRNDYNIQFQTPILPIINHIPQMQSFMPIYIYYASRINRTCLRSDYLDHL